jgi:hypothetical protein
MWLELAHVTAGDIVYDLVWRRLIPIAAAKQHGAFGVGIEIDAKLNREAPTTRRRRASAIACGSHAGSVRGGDQPGDGGDALLLPRINQELIPKLRREPSGTRIVSHQFDMGEQAAGEVRTSTG